MDSNGMSQQANYGNIPMAPHSDPMMLNRAPSADDDFFGRQSSSSAYADYPSAMSEESSPYNMSPWHQSGPPCTSPYSSSPWSLTPSGAPDGSADASSVLPCTTLIGSLVREEGHIHSLAASGGLLYTGSDSKNIRVWKKQEDYAGFKSGSGFVKAMIIAGDRIFTGHQDGKIRVWKVSPKNPTVHKRVGSLPKLKDFIRSSLKPSNYVEVRRHRSALWIRHSEAISCLSLSEDQGLLYSGSWDRTFKIWRIADSRCLESVIAHDDAVNSIASAFDGLVFTASADGTVKVWRRELHLKTSKHSPVQTLLKQECAVTSLAVSPTAPVVYCGSSDGLINFWEGERHLTHGGVLRSHKMAVLCLVAAGSLLLSGSADKTICVWRRDGGVHSCLSVLSAHTGPVKCLAIEAEAASGEEGSGGAAAAGTTWIVYSGSLDKSVKVWRVYEQAPEALLKGPQNLPPGSNDFGSYSGSCGDAPAYSG